MRVISRQTLRQFREACSGRTDARRALVEAYENRRFPIDDPDPLSAIEFRMDQPGLTRKDLEPLLGSRGRVSEVLNGRRAHSLQMIRRLNRELGIPLDNLVGRD